LVVLAALGVALIASARGTSAPDGWTPEELHAWYTTQPVSATFRVGALGALIAVLYLIVGTVGVVLETAARAAHLPRLDRVAKLIAVPAVRRSLSGLLGLGLGLTAAMPSTSVHAAEPPVVAEPSEPSGIATMRAIDDVPLPTPSAPGPGKKREWVIQSGDHLWGLAEITLLADLGRPPTDTEIAALVHAVVDWNRHTFVVPGQPDLVFPGQVFALPP
jgi:nucleoid-associated protein YgaU